ncbi:MAG TPA: FAD-binding oxidoreductase [Vicinamibacterales bacterium]|nr:FAD-binding oxidoreductase [Vicinamibacterales bacterium]
MPGYGVSYWSDRTGPSRRRSYPAFRGDDTADAVIIGGGLTGCLAAFVLAKGGANVVLFEADRLARGSTASSIGAIVPQPDASFRTVESLSGKRVARTAWKETRRAAQEFATALAKHRINADLHEAPLLVSAGSADEAADLRREQAARKAAGVDAAWVTGSAVQAETGLESTGAIRLREASVIDPVRTTLALAAKADDAGARLFERSEVRRTTFTRKYADVHLASGKIRTTLVYVATGAPGRLFSQLRRHVHERTGFVVVTEPLNAAMRREAGKRASIVTEASAEPHWLRWLADDRAMFAGAAAAPVAARQRDKVLVPRTAQLMYELSVRYPVISGLPAKWGWDLPIVSTFDGLPWIGPHRNYPFHFFAMAFGWHGDSLAWLAARAALRSLRGEWRKDDDAFGFVRHL